MNKVKIESATFEFIERVNAADCIAKVQELLAQELVKYGYTQFIIVDVPPPGQRLEGYTIVNGCAEDWFAHYTTENLHLHDPIMRHMRTTIDPFYWDEVIVDDEDRGEQRMMHDLADFRLNEGLSIPIFGPNGDQSCVAMGGTHVDRDPRVRCALQIISMYAHMRARALRGHAANAAAQDIRPHLLTAREREVLRWVASGKTDWEIGEILSISKETSFAHVRNCCHKLNATTRPQAVAKAMLMGEISVDA